MLRRLHAITILRKDGYCKNLLVQLIFLIAQDIRKTLLKTTHFRSHALGHSKTIASSGSSKRMILPFSLVPNFVLSLKAFSICGAPSEVRRRARPVIIILSCASNSTLVISGSYTVVATITELIREVQEHRKAKVAYEQRRK